MKTVKEIMQLLEGEAAKAFIMDADGEVRLVLMPVGEYQKIKGVVPQKAAVVSADPIVDPEAVNQKILEARVTEQAQMGAVVEWSEEQQVAKGLPFATKGNPFEGAGHPYAAGQPPRVHAPTTRTGKDLREEVIDPSFNFDGPEEI